MWAVSKGGLFALCSFDSSGRHRGHVIHEHYICMPSGAPSGCLPLRVPWEECCLSNIPQTQPKHRNAIQAETSTTMWRTTHLERIHIMLEAFALGI